MVVIMNIVEIENLNFSYKDNYMEYLKRYQDIAQHSEESIYYTSKQRDIPDSFPVEHYRMLEEDESALFVALE